MRVAIIGGTGFVGHYITRSLLEAGHQPVLLVRNGSEDKVFRAAEVETVSGEVGDHDAITSLMKGADAAIYLVGILREFANKGITFRKLQFEGAKEAIDTAVEAGVQRFLLMSANGVKPDGTSYQNTKYEAEEYLKTTQLDWTVFRPSVLFGDPQGHMEFATQLRDELIKPPVPAPLFFEGLNALNAGVFEMSPTHITDVASAFTISLKDETTINRTFSLCGPENISWKKILQTLAKVSGKNKVLLPAPAWGVKSVATFLDRYEFFPISRDQITMLLEGNTCNGDNGYNELGIVPHPFNSSALSYLNQAQ